MDYFIVMTGISCLAAVPVIIVGQLLKRLHEVERANFLLQQEVDAYKHIIERTPAQEKYEWYLPEGALDALTQAQETYRLPK